MAPDAEQEGKNGQSQKILASEMGKKIEEPVPRSQKTEKRQRQGGAASGLKEAEDVGPHLLSHELFSRNDEFSSVADHVGFQAVSLFEGLYRNAVSFAQAGK